MKLKRNCGFSRLIQNPNISRQIPQTSNDKSGSTTDTRNILAYRLFCLISSTNGQAKAKGECTSLGRYCRNKLISVVREITPEKLG